MDTQYKWGKLDLNIIHVLYLMLQRLSMQQFYWILVPLFDLDHHMFRPLHKAIFRWMFCGPCYTYTPRHVQVALLFM
jgi:hypothetical protein